MQFDEKIKRLKEVNKELHMLFKQRKAFLITAERYAERVRPLVAERNTLSSEINDESGRY